MDEFKRKQTKHLNYHSNDRRMMNRQARQNLNLQDIKDGIVPRDLDPIETYMMLSREDKDKYIEHLKEKLK